MSRSNKSRRKGFSLGQLKLDEWSKLFNQSAVFYRRSAAFLVIFGGLLLRTCGNLAYFHKSSSSKYTGDRIQVGERTWMPQDLYVDCYTDGTPLHRATNADDWKQCNEKGEGCYYDVGTVRYYNFYAVFDNKHKGIIPPGWQLPSIGDLENIRYKDHILASVLKDTLGIFLTGYLTPNCQLHGIDSVATYWLGDVSDKHPDVNGYPTWWFCMHIQTCNDSVNWDDQSKYYGYPIRCVERTVNPVAFAY
jgi:hypothetical protein